jgi:hypothetical protein
MRVVYSLFVSLTLALTACQTPGGVIDTATSVSQLATKLNGAVSDYVSASNTKRVEDEKSLAQAQHDSALRTAANDDQFKILDLSTRDERARAIVAALRTTVVVTPVSQQSITASEQARLATEFGNNSFDPGPLTQVATATGELAKLRDLKDELVIFGTFSKQVYDELKAAKQDLDSSKPGE